MPKSYIHFTELFGRLSPYELKHLSECILCKLEAEFEETLCGASSKAQLTKNEIKSALTDAMQSILLELRQCESQKDRIRINMKLKETEGMVFADREVA